MKALLRVLGFMLLAVVAWIALIQSGWLTRPTSDQRSAVALMREPPRVLGQRNAYAAFWFSPYDVPEADQERLMAEDIEAWKRFHASERTNHDVFASTAKGRYAAIERPAQKGEGLCGVWQAGCLSLVRDHADSTRAALAKYPQFAAFVARLGQYDHVKQLLPMSFDMPIPSMAGTSQMVLSAAALKAIDGDSAGALADTCGFASTWRQLRSHTDFLIVDMIGLSNISAAAQLAAEVVAAAPAASLAWPESCAAAFAPLADAELDQCEEWKAEFRGGEEFLNDPRHDLFEQFGSDSSEPSDSWKVRAEMLLVNRDHVLASSALEYARLCAGSRVGAPSSARAPLAKADLAARACGGLELAFNPLGCSAFLSQTPDYTRYQRRVLDLDGRLTTLRAALWLRERSAEDGHAADFAARPSDLRPPNNPVVLDATARTLTMTSLDLTGTAGRDQWTIPYGAASAGTRP